MIVVFTWNHHRLPHQLLELVIIIDVKLNRDTSFLAKYNAKDMIHIKGRMKPRYDHPDINFFIWYEKEHSRISEILCWCESIRLETFCCSQIMTSTELLENVLFCSLTPEMMITHLLSHFKICQWPKNNCVEYFTKSH